MYPHASPCLAPRRWDRLDERDGLDGPDGFGLRGRRRQELNASAREKRDKQAERRSKQVPLLIRGRRRGRRRSQHREAAAAVHTKQQWAIFHARQPGDGRFAPGSPFSWWSSRPHHFHTAADQGATREKSRAEFKLRSSPRGCGLETGANCIRAGPWEAAGIQAMQQRGLLDASSSCRAAVWSTVVEGGSASEVEGQSSKNRPRAASLAAENYGYTVVNITEQETVRPRPNTPLL
jgi:hypothetical protein